MGRFLQADVDLRRAMMAKTQVDDLAHVRAVVSSKRGDEHVVGRWAEAVRPIDLAGASGHMLDADG